MVYVGRETEGLAGIKARELVHVAKVLDYGTLDVGGDDVVEAVEESADVDGARANSRNLRTTSYHQSYFSTSLPTFPCTPEAMAHDRDGTWPRLVGSRRQSADGAAADSHQGGQSSAHGLGDE